MIFTGILTVSCGIMAGISICNKDEKGIYIFGLLFLINCIKYESERIIEAVKKKK